MSISSWLRTFRSTSSSRWLRRRQLTATCTRPRRSPAWQRLRLEQLEDRITPSAVTWTGSGDGTSWTDKNNWNTAQLPGSSDDVVINKSGAVVLYQGGSTTVNSITDSNTLKVESGSLTTNQYVQQNNGTLQVDSGTLSGGTGISVSSGTLNYNGGTLSGTVTLANSALNFGSGGTGAASFVLEGSDTLSGNVASGQTLLVQGNSILNQNASLTDQGNVTNAGTIELQSSGGSYSDTLSSNGNTFTNAAGGSIQVNAGSGGGRYLEGTFTNAAGATVSVAANITLWVNDNAATTFTNQGQMNVDPNGLLIIEHTYNADGGTIGGPGYVYSGVLEESTNATPTTIQVAGNTTLATNNLANMIIAVQGNSALNQNATLTDQGNITNYGTIQLQSSGGGYSDTLSSNGNTFTNAAGGSIQVNANGGGGRYLEGTFTNAASATVSVAANITLWVNDSAAATFTNQGQMNVDPNGLLIIEHTYNADGGTIGGGGPGYVYNGVLEESTNATPTTIQVAGNTTLATNNLANMIIAVQGNSALNQNATLLTNSGLSNYGTIQLQSSGGSYSDTLSSNGNTFTNAAGGSIQVNAGSGGGRYLEGTFTNAASATVSVAANITLWVNDSAATTFTNQGQMNVDPNGLLIIEHTYNADGGTIGGPGYVYSGVLEESTNATPTTIQVAGNTTLATNNLANMIIAVQGNSALNQNATLIDQGNITNYGTIQLQSSGGGYSDTLSSNGNTFTNAAGGSIQVNANGGGGRYLEGTFTNAASATVSVAANITLWVNDSAAATFTNQGQMNVDPNGLLIIEHTYNADGGTIGGPGYVFNGVLEESTNATPTTIQVFGNTTLATNNLANMVIVVQGNSYLFGQNATLIDQGNITNYGTIQLQSSGGGYSDTLSSNGNTFTNAAGGSIQVNANGGGNRYLEGTFTNAAGATVSVAANITLWVNDSAAATFTNQGQMKVDANGLLIIEHTYNADGGVIQGPGYVFNGVLEESTNATPTTIQVFGNTTLATNNLANMVIVVQGNSYLFGQNATLTAQGNVTNYGTIQLQSSGGSYSETLSSGSGTFTNAAKGIIQVNVGTGGGNRYLEGAFTNATGGTINVTGSETLSIGGSNWSNAGTINVSDDTLDLSGLNLSKFTNTSKGVINFDTTNGNAAISANDTLSNAGTINVAGTNVLYLENGLTLSNSSTGKFIFTDDSSLSQSGNGYLVNAGTVEKTKGTGTSTISTSSLNNTGTVAVYSGTLDVTAPVTQVSTSTLTAGSWSAFGSSAVSSTLTIGGSAGSITTIGSNAKVTLSGLNSSFTNINGSGGLNSISAGGSFSILAGQSFTTAGNLTSAGSIILTSGTLNVTGNLSNTGSAILTAGTLNVNGTVAQLSGTSLTGGTWTVNASSNLNFALGSNITALTGANVTLNGANSNFAALANLATVGSTSSFSLLGGRSFTAAGSFTNNGKLTVGPGSTLTANGSFTQASTATLTIQIGGTNAAPTRGQVVSSSGTVTLAGKLQVTSTVVPAVGSSLEILANNGGSPISGTFTGLAEGATFTVKVGATTMTFKISYVGDGGNNVVITRIS